MDGKLLISDVNERFGLDIDDSELDTIGGWILMQKPEVESGTSVEVQNYQFKVKEMEGHQVKRVEAIKKEKNEPDP
ncbi:hypothetical protein KBTX_04534 [wastewater metagenome]|uniref:Transporter-associated domain-containing protein n=2 Tax=unclassified sequences TaxID=12908 RepID=A0A5B8RLG6_9ZZZZ|nr:hypothetical protein KBTEX_04534 [uncultured organism]